MRFQMKEGSGWLCAAAACGAAMVLSAVLLWGDGTPQIPGGHGTWGPSIWRLPDGLGLILLVVLLFGVPFTAILTFIGLILRLGLRAALWIAGLALFALILILQLSGIPHWVHWPSRLGWRDTFTPHAVANFGRPSGALNVIRTHNASPSLHVPRSQHIVT